MAKQLFKNATCHRVIKTLVNIEKGGCYSCHRLPSALLAVGRGIFENLSVILNLAPFTFLDFRRVEKKKR